MTTKWLRLAKQSPKSIGFEKWLREWEATYYECARAEIPHVHEHYAVTHFLNAVEDISRDFASYTRIRAIEDRSLGLPEVI